MSDKAKRPAGAKARKNSVGSKSVPAAQSTIAPGAPHTLQATWVAASRTPQFRVFGWRCGAVSDASRISMIKMGFQADVVTGVVADLGVPQAYLCEILDIPKSTLSRKLHKGQPLDPASSERLDRIGIVATLAADVLGSEANAKQWLTSSNTALGMAEPLALLDTEIGANLVRQALHAIEWGGAI